MTPVEFIRTKRPATAAELTEICGLSHEEVYLDLVKGEERGQVRIDVRWPKIEGKRTPQPEKYWEAA